MVVIAVPNARSEVKTPGRLMTEILVVSRRPSLDGEARAERVDAPDADYISISISPFWEERPSIH